MQDIEEIFKEKICNYCKDNIGEKILFTGFTHLWPLPEKEISPKDLAILTSKILYDLNKGKRIIIKEVSKPEEFSIPYAMYEILSYKND